MYYGRQEHEGPILPSMETDLDKMRAFYRENGYERLDVEDLKPHELEVWAHENEADETIVCLDASQQPIPCDRS